MAISTTSADMLSFNFKRIGQPAGQRLLIALVCFVFLFLLWNSPSVLYRNPPSRGTGLWSNPADDRLASRPGLAPDASAGHLSSCERTMMFRFTNRYGFFSELQLYTRVASLGRSLNYTILVDDSDWNYGKLNDYFEFEAPPCSKSPSLKLVERKSFCDEGSGDSDHIDISRICVSELDHVIAKRIDQTVLRVQAVWTFQNQRDEVQTLPASQNLHAKMAGLFEQQARELMRVWRLNKSVLGLVAALEHRMDTSGGWGWWRRRRSRGRVVGLHYRLGDKKNEQSANSMGPQLIGIPPAFDKPSRLLGTALAMARTLGWPNSEPRLTVVTMSDDIDNALTKLESYKHAFAPPLPLTLVGLAIKRSGAGHEQVAFNKKPLKERVALARQLLSEVEWLRRHADGTVCSATSNICTAMMMLVGSADRLVGPTPSVRSVDQRWAPTSYPGASYAKLLDTEKMVELAKQLARDERNYINLDPFEPHQTHSFLSLHTE